MVIVESRMKSLPCPPVALVLFIFTISVKHKTSCYLSPKDVSFGFSDLCVLFGKHLEDIKSLRSHKGRTEHAGVKG